MKRLVRKVHSSTYTHWLIAVIAGVLLLALTGTAAAQYEDYDGPESCKQCHEENYNQWKASGHPYKLMKGEEARHRAIPLPEGSDWDDISYVIGGYKWKSRYMDSNGYIITNDSTTAGGNTQYNYLTGEWSNYHADEANGTKPYNCGRCHTTGWIADEDTSTPEGKQDGLEGIHGTFFAGGIQCEQCHGPGFGSMNVDYTAEACGECHIRGDADTIPASGGFIRHHEQYNEHLAGAHGAVECGTCHNPHKRGEFSIWKDGEEHGPNDSTTGAVCGVSCHTDKMESYSKTSMYDYGVECKDCHMPYATKSAKALGPVVDGNQTKGDVQTHIFYIDTDPMANMFTEDGGFVKLDGDGKAAVTMNFACQRCHETASLDELALFAEDFHDENKGLENFGIDPGLSGTWWNPTKSGEGFLIEVDSNKFMYVSLYTYGPDGEQTWLVAALTSASGTTANVTVYIPSGGTWGDPSGAATDIEWGTGQFNFPTCTAGSFTITPNQAMMDMGFTELSYDLERILPSGTACPTFVNNEMAAATR
ncbi:MAG: hypothetical protein HKN57_07990 [Xanthomonadales bacterium]|nr:hypothetical protein [Gammaproteobacteria bacterium]NND57178.1 hypothetical protein [Xanthomonadales bacterium]